LFDSHKSAVSGGSSGAQMGTIPAVRSPQVGFLVETRQLARRGATANDLSPLRHDRMDLHRPLIQCSGWTDLAADFPTAFRTGTQTRSGTSSANQSNSRTEVLSRIDWGSPSASPTERLSMSSSSAGASRAGPMPAKPFMDPSSRRASRTSGERLGRPSRVGAHTREQFQGNQRAEPGTRTGGAGRSVS